MNDPVSLSLRPSSWKQIFETLYEEGLRGITPEREKIYEKGHGGEFYSRGNFWAAIHSLEAQFAQFAGRDD